jgi:hypothetical protein
MRGAKSQRTDLETSCNKNFSTIFHCCYSFANVFWRDIVYAPRMTLIHEVEVIQEDKRIHTRLGEVMNPQATLWDLVLQTNTQGINQDW